jgi:outer membrane receptor protein involved in Fe transport
VQALVRLGEGQARGWTNGLTLRAGVINLFDEEPPFSQSNGVSGYDQSQGDIRQRFAYVAITKAF